MPLPSLCAAWFLSFLLSFSTFVTAGAQPEDHSAITSEEITFSNNTLPLAGTLLLPAGTAPFPGVVIVHGSGSSSRSNPWTSAYAKALVERGIAVLHPDKRGSGASGGDWREATFEDLADDAIAALDVLHAHPAIDTARVGLIGFSQGGHVIPVAATRSPKASFLVNVSGSVVPMMEQIGDELRMMGEQEGLAEEELLTVQSIHERAIHYVLTGEGWDRYADALTDAKRGPLGGSEVVAGFPTEPDSPAWHFLRTMGNFDPLPYWRNVQIPTIFLYGGRDENVDVYKSADIIERQLTPTGLPYSLLLLSTNGHALFRDDAMDFIARWVRDKGVD